MPGRLLSLFEVLVEEYESQGLQPPFPREPFDEMRERHREALAPLCPGDEDELRRRLDAAMVRDFYSWLHANGVRRSALCFSGGGIRSATFGLGIVEGLARHGLLKRFDFLSTVSGGGYLGSWLSSWISRTRDELEAGGAAPGRPAVEVVEERLRRRPDSPLEPEPEQVRYLRSFSRYMSPKLGLLSADTWTLVAVFLRNLFLNWLVLLPLMAAGLMVPRASVILVRLGTRDWFIAQEGWILPTAFWLAVAFGSIAIGYIILNRSGIEEHRAIPGKYRSQQWFLVLCLLPLFLMAVLISLDWAWLRSTSEPLSELSFQILRWQVHPAALFVAFGMLVHLGGFVLARIRVPRYVPGELIVILLTGALGGAAAWIAAWHLFPTAVATSARPHVNTVLASELYVCFAAPLLLLLFLLAATLFVGLSSYYTNDADREWLARAGGWVLIAIVVRCSFSVVVIFGPDAFMNAVAAICSVGGLSGFLTLLLGRSSRTEAQTGPAQEGNKKTRSLLDVALSLAAPLFALFILILLSLGATLLIRWTTDFWLPGHVWPTQIWGSREASMLMDVVYGSPWWAVGSVFLGLALIGGVMGWFVDINRFSLHAAYRDRLIRAYMGASRGRRRRPHPFTGFDEDDNLQVSALRGSRPFHLVNMALNLVAGNDPAWQDRKAENFTASGLHAGSFRLGYRDAREYGRHRDDPDRAISLGTAMAISGAAASPNMGYHSSPIVTFLLALFNVRLGWWLGNPGTAGEDTYATPGPRFAPYPLFAEAFGLTDDQHPYIYLSDGGHFENLALYEMVLRRCHFVVVSDGGQDSAFSFEDLGNAVSKIRVDLGVPIRFERILIRPRPADPKIYDVRVETEKKMEIIQPYCAVARICYSCVDALPEGAQDRDVMDGFLLYIKPSLNGTEPVDVFNYARLHPDFPHESTANQLYTEQQFESYRELGSHTMGTILSGLPAEAALEDVFEKIGKELGMPGC